MNMILCTESVAPAATRSNGAPRSPLRWRTVILTACAFAATSPMSAAFDPPPLIFTDDFEHDFNRWETTDPDPEKPFWKLASADASYGNSTQVLRVVGPSNYQPPHRSPHSIALVKGLVVGNFEMSVRTQSTNVDAGPHRDMCLFWGYQDPAHFYYVHLGAKPDPHACQIFIVNEAPRTAITTKTAVGTPWTKGWHTVKIARNVQDGAMAVYFDDMSEPHLSAKDKTFVYGRVGLGTFDDNGNWDDFRLHGEIVAP
ncbi:MAG: hypothetical protein AAF961_16000, partial [Planctomycetota bacterium]